MTQKGSEMTELLDHLGRGTLPEEVIKEFVHWCVMEQGRPGFIKVLNTIGFDDLAEHAGKTDDYPALLELSVNAHQDVKEFGAKNKTGPLGLSAVEAATYEFGNLMRATQEDPVDVEAVAFFGARVAGWAGWAETHFTEPQRKASAEADARQVQEQMLQTLFNQESDTAS